MLALVAIMATGMANLPPDAYTAAVSTATVTTDSPPVLSTRIFNAEEVFHSGETAPVLVVKPLISPPTSPALFAWNTPVEYEVVLLAAAHLAIAVDVYATLRFAPTNRWTETNWFLNMRPSNERGVGSSNERVIIIGYILPAVLMTAAWLALPSHWRNIIPVSVLLSESFVFQTHLHYGNL